MEKYWVANILTSNFTNPVLLNRKICIWLIAFAVVSLATLLVKENLRQVVTKLCIAFYLVACVSNVVMIPHPSWFVLATIGIVIVPFLVVPNIITFVTIVLHDMQNPHTNNTTTLNTSKQLG